MIRNFILMTFGIIFVLKGILFLAFPWKMKDWMELFLEKSDNFFRIWGIVVFVIGLIFLGGYFLGKFLPIF